MLANSYGLAGILLAGMALSVWFKKLTPLAALTGGLAGWLVSAGAGFAGMSMMATFFVLGTAATSVKSTIKAQHQAAEANHGRRKASQVLANAGIGALAGAVGWWYPTCQPAMQLVMAASFSSATADTLSSELGTVYGRRFYNVLTLRTDQRGLDGVISLEGTLAGVVGSAIIALIYCLGSEWKYFGWLILCGTLGNLADSVLGATLERRQMIKNDAVNFLNTLIAGLLGLAAYYLL